MLNCTVPVAGPGAGQRPPPHFLAVTLGAPNCLGSDERERNRSARARHRNWGRRVEKGVQLCLESQRNQGK